MRVNIEAISECRGCKLRPDCSFGDQSVRLIDSKAVSKAEGENLIQNYIAGAKEVNIDCPRTGVLFTSTPNQ